MLRPGVFTLLTASVMLVCVSVWALAGLVKLSVISNCLTCQLMWIGYWQLAIGDRQLATRFIGLNATSRMLQRECKLQ